jgi:hypothetical protein
MCTTWEGQRTGRDEGLCLGGVRRMCCDLIHICEALVILRELRNEGLSRSEDSVRICIKGTMRNERARSRRDATRIRRCR